MINTFFSIDLQPGNKFQKTSNQLNLSSKKHKYILPVFSEKNSPSLYIKIYQVCFRLKSEQPR